MNRMISNIILLAIALIGVVNAASVGSPIDVTITVAKPDGEFKIADKLKDIKLATCRIPKALVKSVGESAKTFVSSSSVLIPINLALTINKMRPIDMWLLNGMYKGSSWAKTSAIFVGAETFIGNVRNKQDKLNRQLASGVSSSIMRMSDGPAGMTQGFCIGFGMMYALDSAFPDRGARKPSQWMRPMLDSALSASIADPIPTATTTATTTAATTAHSTPSAPSAPSAPSSKPATSTAGSAETKPKSAGIGGFLRSFKIGK